MLNRANPVSQDWRGCTSSPKIHPWLFVPVLNCSDTGERISKRDTQAYAYQATSSYKFLKVPRGRGTVSRRLRAKDLMEVATVQIGCTFLARCCPQRVKRLLTFADLTKISCTR